MKWTGNLLLAVNGMLWLASAGQAALLSGAVTGGDSFAQGGIFVELTPPFTESTPNSTIGINTFDDWNLYAVKEQQKVTLAQPLVVDVGATPIPAGTVISSHFLAYDPEPTATLVGQVEFDSPILGVILENQTLAASDFLAVGVTHQLSSLRGLENGDIAVISAPHQLRVELQAGHPGDYLRVITAGTVPEPTTSLLAVAGIVLVLWVQRKGRSPAG